MIIFSDKEYFYSDSYFKKYDYDFLKQLADVWNNGEGSTFYSPNLDEQKKQLKFHKKVFSKLKPKNILEIGTHKANYAYFCKKELSDIKIVTFGIDEQSKDCIDLVNEYFSEDFIEFYCGDSVKTLTEYDSNIQFDLAWVDGGHSYECAISDLNNCQRLGIKNILVDDVALISTVKSAVESFLEQNNDYKIIGESKDERNIVWLSSSL